MRKKTDILRDIDTKQEITIGDIDAIMPHLLDVLKASSVLVAHLLSLSNDELTRRGVEVGHYIALKNAIEKLSE